MADPNTFACGGIAAADLPRGWGRGGQPVRLAIGPGTQDVHLDLPGLEPAAAGPLPDAAADLLELATYVYVADQAVSRGGDRVFEYGTRWHRHLRLAVPVRRPDVWNRPDVRAALGAAVGFLTGDRYGFHFVPDARPPRRWTSLFGKQNGDPGGGGIEEVVLFSGGLDSLCGAVDEVLVGHRRVALISHRSCGQTYARRDALAREIRRRAPAPGSPRSTSRWSRTRGRA